MDGMTDERLAAIEARVALATPGPWHSGYQPEGPCGAMCYSDQVQSWDHVVIFQRPHAAFRGPGRKARDAEMYDARFAADARQDVPDLIAEVHRLRNEAAKQACIADIYRRKVEELEAEVAQLRTRQPESGNG